MSRTSRIGGFSREVINKIQVKLPALSVNEGMARATVAAFVSQLDPGVTEIADIDDWKAACAPMTEEYLSKGPQWQAFYDVLTAVE